MNLTSKLRRGVGCAVAGVLIAGLAGGVWAQSIPAQAPANADSDTSPVVAEVDGHPIHLDEVGDFIRSLPDGGGDNAFATLFPFALQRLIEREALVVRAYDEGVVDLPEVRRSVQEATNKLLEAEYLQHKIAPTITESELLARYKADVQGKPGPELVHAWAILVPTEDQADNIIAALNAGADFAAMARRFSKDSTAAKGGDLGFVRRSSLAPEIAAVVFSLRPGAVTAYPVRTAAGWFVLKAQSRGQAPTPSFAEARAGLLAKMIRERVPAFAANVVKAATIRIYGLAGKAAAAN